jgi:nicotinamidase/pyrazinamidase
MNALLIIDLQKDFLPGGALPAPEGDRIIPVINRIMGQFDTVLASKDWHPEKSGHFERWPPHCIRDTEGAQFADHFNEGFLTKVFLKGTGMKDDGYSAFEATSDDLDSYLKANGIRDLFLAGLTTEYCVKATALDAVDRGYRTVVIKDAVAGVNARPGDPEKALQEMEAGGVVIAGTDRLDLNARQ